MRGLREKAKKAKYWFVPVETEGFDMEEGSSVVAKEEVTNAEEEATSTGSSALVDGEIDDDGKEDVEIEELRLSLASGTSEATELSSNSKCSYYKTECTSDILILPILW